MSPRTPLSAALILAAGLAFTAPPSFAQGDSLYFEGFAGLGFADIDVGDNETAFGLRGGYRFDQTWGVEAALSQTEVGFVDINFIDLSARRSLTGNGDTEVFVFSGFGLVRVEIDTPFFSDSDSDFTFHTGIGLDYALGENFYLRPDARLRWLATDAAGDSLFSEVTLGVGYRF